MLGVEGGRLHYQAPEGALTAELRGALVANRSAVLRLLAAEASGWSGNDGRDFLAERAAVREYGAGLSRALADRLAMNDLDRHLGIVVDYAVLTVEQVAALFDAV